VLTHDCGVSARAVVYRSAQLENRRQVSGSRGSKRRSLLSAVPDAVQAETDGGSANVWDSQIGSALGNVVLGFGLRAEAKNY
jgi:hypothetical protein